MKLMRRALLVTAVSLAFGTVQPNQADAGGLFAKLFKGKCGASEPACCEPEPVCCEPAPEPEPVCCEPAPEPEPVCCEPATEPEPVCCEPAPEPEPVCCEPEPEPVPCCTLNDSLPELGEGEVLLSISPILVPIAESEGLRFAMSGR